MVVFHLLSHTILSFLMHYRSRICCRSCCLKWWKWNLYLPSEQGNSQQKKKIYFLFWFFPPSIIKYVSSYGQWALGLRYTFSSNHNIQSWQLMWPLILGCSHFTLIDFTQIYQLKGLKLKTKGLTKLYEFCDLTKNYI